MMTMKPTTAQQLRSDRAVLRSLRWASALLMLTTLSGTAVGEEKDTAKKDTVKSEIDRDLGLKAEVSTRPDVVDGHFVMPPLEARSTGTDDVGNGKIPDGFRDKQDRPLQSLPESGDQRGTQWNWTLADWAAPNTFSNPRYFEDRMLERHGHERFGCAQPLASGVRFVTTIPMLPYLMAIQHPCDCEYTLGYYRPGSCAPLTFQRPPWDRRAIIAESAAVATGMIVLP